MKRRTTPTKVISIPGIDVSTVSQVDFIFKEVRSEDAPAILTKTYPSDDVVYDESDGLFYMSFSEAETLLFETDYAYMDTRICLDDGKIPPTKIAGVRIHPTLFGDDDI